MGLHDVRVGPVPDWVPVDRWLGPLGWRRQGGEVVAELPREQAADVDAMLRGVALAGVPVVVSCRPRLKRPWVREARTREARRRRATTPGFTRRGARLDEQGRISLTPEDLALELGERYAGARVVDPCAGAGGNAIGFARAGCRVIAIEPDADRLADARHNAALYGVSDAIRFVHGDAREVLPRCEGDVLFVDPPWEQHAAGPSKLTDHPLLRALWSLGTFTTRLAKLPAGFDPETLPGAAPEAIFGTADGDRHRIKYLLCTLTTGSGHR